MNTHDLISRLFSQPHEHVSDRELLFHLVKENHIMTLALTAITDALAKVSADVDALIKNDTAVAAAVSAAVAADQAQVDALVPQVTAVSAKIDAVLNPTPVAAEPPAAPPVAG